MLLPQDFGHSESCFVADSAYVTQGLPLEHLKPLQAQHGVESEASLGKKQPCHMLRCAPHSANTAGRHELCHTSDVTHYADQCRPDAPESSDKHFQALYPKKYAECLIYDNALRFGSMQGAAHTHMDAGNSLSNKKDASTLQQDTSMSFEPPLAASCACRGSRKASDSNQDVSPRKDARTYLTQMQAADNSHAVNSISADGSQNVDVIPDGNLGPFKVAQKPANNACSASAVQNIPQAPEWPHGASLLPELRELDLSCTLPPRKQASVAPAALALLGRLASLTYLRLDGRALDAKAVETLCLSLTQLVSISVDKCFSSRRALECERDEGLLACKSCRAAVRPALLSSTCIHDWKHIGM
jgi:hypothetical protein